MRKTELQLKYTSIIFLPNINLGTMISNICQLAEFQENRKANKLVLDFQKSVEILSLPQDLQVKHNSRVIQTVDRVALSEGSPDKVQEKKEWKLKRTLPLCLPLCH